MLSRWRSRARYERKIPVVHPTFTVADSFRELFSLTRLQFSETVKNVFFGVLRACRRCCWPFSPLAESPPRSQTPVYPVT